MAEEYNADIGPNETGILERWLLSSARVNLYVKGTDDSEAVVSFRTDHRLRITSLQQGRYEHPTLRVRASREAIERIADAEDRPATINREVWNGRVRIKRIYEPLPGVSIAIGVGEAILGAGSVVLATAAVAKFGVQGVLSALRGGLQKVLSGLLSAGRALWRRLGSIATALTVLDQLGLLKRVRETVEGVYERIRAAVLGVGARLQGTEITDVERDDEGDE